VFLSYCNAGKAAKRPTSATYPEKLAKVVKKSQQSTWRLIAIVLIPKENLISVL